MRAVAGALLCVALAAPARAQMESREGIMLQNQILELRRDMQLLQQRGPTSDRGYDRQPVPPPSGTSGLDAQLLDRVQTLEDQVRRLRGQLDETSNALRVAQEQLAKQVEDMNFRLGNGAASPRPAAPPPSAPSSSPPAPQADAPPTGPVRRTPELALQEGNAALARRDYTAAEAAAREVLAARNSPRTGDANFLLAQSLMGNRNFQGAAVSYDDAYNFARTSPRAPDALLGLANALTGLNERPAACATLDKLKREFPTVRGSVRETAATLRGRNGCS